MDKRILIVEDEQKIARFLEMELRHEGFAAAKEENGLKALDRIVQEYDMASDLGAVVETRVKNIQDEVNRRGKQLENEMIEFQNKLDKGLITRSVANVQGQELQKKEAEFQRIIDDLASGLSNLQTQVGSLNEHCLDYTSIRDGWGTVDMVRKIIDEYHTAAHNLDQLRSSLKFTATYLSTKSFDNIRISTHSNSLTPQQNRAFRRYISDYANACRVLMDVVKDIHQILVVVSADMTTVFSAVEMARTKLERGVTRAKKLGYTQNGTTVTVVKEH